ncbi:ABC transporter permease [Antribacter sp. KLBMP9083]|uniref:Transport permease protein n=1 Tax=Antribacter soli TaxID=2910976 RepID=A0AA41QBJ1_9MICO|nr:ABC transporter permease [Antribacter soli]MCF4120112.1 ABC transporter permease [Antribacter soli]
MVTPGIGRGLLDVVERRFLLRLIVRKELRVRYRGSVLGMAWSYVKPAIQFGVYFVALGVFLRMRDTVPDYAVYLFAGIVVMNFFGEGFGNATRSIIWNAPLINKIYLPRELFPVASLYVSAVHFFPQLVVLLVAALISGWRPTVAEVLAAVVGFLIVAMLALGLGLLFGAANVFFRDAENFVDLIVMVATWASPVLYTWGLVQAELPRWLWFVYQANPLTAAVELFHYAFWYGGTGRPALLPNGTAPIPDNLWAVGGGALVVSLVVLVVGQLVFRRLEGRFAQEL